MSPFGNIVHVPSTENTLPLSSQHSFFPFFTLGDWIPFHNIVLVFGIPNSLQFSICWWFSVPLCRAISWSYNAITVRRWAEICNFDLYNPSRIWSEGISLTVHGHILHRNLGCRHFTKSYWPSLRVFVLFYTLRLHGNIRRSCGDGIGAFFDFLFISLLTVSEVSGFNDWDKDVFFLCFVEDCAEVWSGTWVAPEVLPDSGWKNSLVSEMESFCSVNPFLFVHVDARKSTGRKQNIDPMMKVLNKEADLGEPTFFRDHVFLGCTQRQCKISKDIVDNYRSCVFLHGFVILEGHAKKCVEWFCELAGGRFNTSTKHLLHVLMTIISKKKDWRIV